MYNQNMKIGDKMENLKKIRLEKGLSQKEVAEALQLTQSSYSKYERGERKPDPETLMKISKFFNIAIDYIVGNIETPITLDELRFYKEVPNKSNEQLMKDYDLVGHNGRELTVDELFAIIDQIRAKMIQKK